MNKFELQSQVIFFIDAYLHLLEENSNLRKRLANAEIDARTDTLTGLGNKRYVLEEVRRLQSLAGRNRLSSSRVCVVSIDMDNLKPINDTYGHATGDKALQALVDTMRSATRASDIIARIGGDEFIIVALFKNKKEIEGFKKRLDAELKEITIRETKISTSAGYHCSKLNAKFDFNKALRLSDKRMYDIKLQKKEAGA